MIIGVLVVSIVLPIISATIKFQEQFGENFVSKFVVIIWHHNFVTCHWHSLSYILQGIFRDNW